jgi:hypothetical protein
MISLKNNFTNFNRLLTFLCILSVNSCQSSDRIEEKSNAKSCKNLQFQGRFFIGETVRVWTDERLVFEKEIQQKDYPLGVEHITLVQDYCVSEIKGQKIYLRSTFEGRIFLDTGFVINSGKLPYHLTVSNPFPKDFQPPATGTMASLPDWGFLPIDSCVRFVSYHSQGFFDSLMYDWKN